MAIAILRYSHSFVPNLHHNISITLSKRAVIMISTALLPFGNVWWLAMSSFSYSIFCKDRWVEDLTYVLQRVILLKVTVRKSSSSIPKWDKQTLWISNHLAGYLPAMSPVDWICRKIWPESLSSALQPQACSTILSSLNLE